MPFGEGKLRRRDDSVHEKGPPAKRTLAENLFTGDPYAPLRLQVM